MKNIRVLHVYKTAMPASYGGIETFIDTLCKTNAALGVHNNVLTLHPSPATHAIDMEGYQIYQAKQNFFIASIGFSLSAFGQFKQLARKADIIHYHFPNPFADLLHMFCLPRKPCIVTYHSDIIRQKYLLPFYRPLQQYFLSAVNHIVATSPNYFASSPVLQSFSPKVSVIPIGLAPEVYDHVDPARLAYWRNRLQQPFFLFVGAMRYYKGLHIALEAIAGTRMRFVIAGALGVENELKAQAALLRLDNVDFLGFVNEQDKIALLHLCCGFLFPSHLRSEAFGISLLEAAIVGKPMISCEIGTGTTFINVANETGLVVQPGAWQDLRQAMQYLVDHPDIAIAMGERAKTRARVLFSAQDQAKAYVGLYQRLVNTS